MWETTDIVTLVAAGLAFVGVLGKILFDAFRSKSSIKRDNAEAASLITNAAEGIVRQLTKRIEELEQEVQELFAENKSLRKENVELRDEVTDLKRQVRELGGIPRVY